jgi:hypothetical protein
MASPEIAVREMVCVPSLGSHPRKELERLCRCIRRPAIANERLSRSAKGKVAQSPMSGSSLLSALKRSPGFSILRL